MGQPITTNPLLIALINMTVVFAVLYGLSLLVSLIRLIDPTVKKAPVAPVPQEKAQEAMVVDEKLSLQDDDEMVLLFTAAIAAYGCKNARIVAIRPLHNEVWSQAARMEAVRGSKQE